MMLRAAIWARACRPRWWCRSPTASPPSARCAASCSRAPPTTTARCSSARSTCRSAAGCPSRSSPRRAGLRPSTSCWTDFGVPGLHDVQEPRDEPRPIEPHPVMPDYYRDRDDRAGFVRGLFNQTAHHYDRINALFSMGSGNWYRRRSLWRAGLRPGHRVLDVATGTGLVARQAVAICGGRSRVLGLDPSEAMLAEARRTLGIPLIQGLAEDLPLADGSVDFVTMGYALRHVSDLTRAFREFHRVLRPGGTVLLLEISRPTRPAIWRLMNLYLGRVVPLVSRITGGG